MVAATAGMAILAEWTCADAMAVIDGTEEAPDMAEPASCAVPASDDCALW